jgi:hypothetical protein
MAHFARHAIEKDLISVKGDRKSRPEVPKSSKFWHCDECSKGIYSSATKVDFNYSQMGVEHL